LSLFYAGKSHIITAILGVVMLVDLESNPHQSLTPNFERKQPHLMSVVFDRKLPVFSDQVNDSSFVVIIGWVRVIVVLNEDDIEVVWFCFAGRGCE